jgi:hypothetical protein
LRQSCALVVDKAEHGGRRVERAVAGGEGRVGQDAAPGLADGGGPYEGGGVVRREADEDVGDEMDRKRPRRRRHGGNCRLGFTTIGRGERRGYLYLIRQMTKS